MASSVPSTSAGFKYKSKWTGSDKSSVRALVFAGENHAIALVGELIWLAIFFAGELIWLVF